MIAYQIPGTKFVAPGHEQGCLCPIGPCVARPADPPERIAWVEGARCGYAWTWWADKDRGGFVLVWCQELGA